MGAMTVTRTEESVAILLSLNLAFRFILLRVHIRGILLHISSGKPFQTDLTSPQIQRSLNPFSHFT